MFDLKGTFTPPNGFLLFSSSFAVLSILLTFIILVFFFFLFLISAYSLDPLAKK